MGSLFKIIVLVGPTLIVALIVGSIIGAGFLFHKPPIPLSPPDLSVFVLGENIRYRVYGKGDPAVILLHGFGGSLGEWEKILPRLHNNRIIALDLLGFGGSDRPAISYGLETQSQYLQAFMKELNVKRAVLVGRSMGASVAAWTAAKSKGKIAGLILIAPSAYPGSLVYPWPLSWIYKPGVWNRFASICVGNSLSRWLFPYSIAPQAVSSTSSYDAKFAAALKDIYQPTLLVWSRGDTTVPFKYHEAYKERIHNIEFVEVPAYIGHGVTRKYPDETASLINEFVSEFSIGI